LADQAVPFAQQENVEWLENRKAFEESKYKHCHFIARESGHPVGYGCLEQQSDDPKLLRIFVVCHPDNLVGEVGDLIYEKLLRDAMDMEAEHLWAHEYQAYNPIYSFFFRHGFIEAKR